MYKCRTTGEPKPLWSFKMIHTVLSTLIEVVEGKVYSLIIIIIILGGGGGGGGYSLW